MYVHAHAYVQLILVNLMRFIFEKCGGINEFGRLGRYSLVLVCYIGTDKLWWIKWCADYQQLTVCTYVRT